MSGTLTLSDYRRLLARLCGFHAALKARMHGVPARRRHGLTPSRTPRRGCAMPT
jgi:hypothetical protein